MVFILLTTASKVGPRFSSLRRCTFWEEEKEWRISFESGWHNGSYIRELEVQSSIPGSDKKFSLEILKYYNAKYQEKHDYVCDQNIHSSYD